MILEPTQLNSNRKYQGSQVHTGFSSQRRAKLPAFLRYRIAKNMQLRPSLSWKTLCMFNRIQKFIMIPTILNRPIPKREVFARNIESRQNSTKDCLGITFEPVSDTVRAEIEGCGVKTKDKPWKVLRPLLILFLSHLWCGQRHQPRLSFEWRLQLKAGQKKYIWGLQGWDSVLS